jgi:hypothetical protein
MTMADKRIVFPSLSIESATKKRRFWQDNLNFVLRRGLKAANNRIHLYVSRRWHCERTCFVLRVSFMASYRLFFHDDKHFN